VDYLLLRCSNCSASAKTLYCEELPVTQIILGENEGIESALRRFKRQVAKAEIFPDMKKNRHFETPLEKRKRKAIARRRKRRFRS